MKYSVKQFTLEQKLRFLEGMDDWHIYDGDGVLPETFLSDGPHGLRKIEDGKPLPATAMPNIASLSNTWNPDLAFLDGETIADECVEYNVSVLLAPGVNIKRTPLCGRNFEYVSEDPYLSGVMGKAYIEGVQSKGIGASLKHFCANNREHDRFNQSSEIDERTLREIYMPAFEIALQAKPWTVMCSYNPVNGVWASENKWLLKDVLRDEFGFNGLIVSDWNAVHDAPRCVKATLDLRMPKRTSFEELKAAYESGELTEAEIDARVEKVLELIEKAETAEKKVTMTKEQRHENAVTIAKEAIVLLKNEDNVLPLKKGKILVAGAWAAQPTIGGGGSSQVRTEFKIPDLATLLDERIPGSNVSLFKMIPSTMTMNTTYVNAYRSDTVVLCIGNDSRDEGEGHDRTTIRLKPKQEDLIVNLAKANKNLVVVVYAGSAIDMSAWIDKVKCVVLAGFAGEGVNEALADILAGKIAPSGKITETFPRCIEDTPSGTALGNGFYERYEEGLMVGYRWYDFKEKEVVFPFGHGLSYADFEYSDLQIEKNGETDYTVSFNVKNLSNMEAKEVSQLYVHDVFAMVERPVKELKGFTKTTLKAGETKRVSIKLNYRSFAYYNVSLKKWHVENGEFEILIGSSSRDIRLSGIIDVQQPRSKQFTLPF